MKPLKKAKKVAKKVVRKPFGKKPKSKNNQLPELRTKKFWQQMPLLKLLWSVKK